MKSFAKFFILITMISFLFFSFTENVKSQPRTAVNFQFFYDQLSAYGNWISYPRYGYVWHPNISSTFHPYRTNGHWVWTLEYEWLWVSDYEWGWAPFHYGRWYYDDFYGWLWVPANEWSPAWVVWRNGIDFYGWAPLGPGMQISLLFNIGQIDFPEYYWSFVPQYYVTSYNVHQHCYHPNQNHDFYKKSNFINGRENHDEKNRQLYVNGPLKPELEERTRQKIKPMNVLESDKPIVFSETNDNIQIYRPIVEPRDKETAKPSFVNPYKNKINSEQRLEAVPKKDIYKDVIQNKDLNPKEPSKEKIERKEIPHEIFTPKQNPKKEIPKKWEPFHKVPEKPTAPPILNKPIQVPKTQNNQLKKLPNKKAEVKRFPY